MPTRIIREGIITSEPINSVSERAELFYRRLMSVADDYGRYFAHPSILRGACYPLRLDTVSEADVKRLLSECVAAGIVVIYGSGKYLHIPKFGQQTRSKSKFPEPLEQPLLIKCESNDKQMLSLVGVEDGGGDEGVVGPAASKKHPSLEEVKLACQKIGIPESDAIWFWNKCEGNGWTNDGKPIRSFAHTLAAWKAAGYLPSQKNAATVKASPVKINELIEYALEKGIDREKASHYASSFHGYWSDQKRKWMRDGRMIDWKIEFAAQLSKWRVK